MKTKRKKRQPKARIKNRAVKRSGHFGNTNGSGNLGKTYHVPTSDAEIKTVDVEISRETQRIINESICWTPASESGSGWDGDSPDYPASEDSPDWGD